VSLIDDALKRVQDASQALTEGRADRPWVPTPMPDEGLARRRRLARRLGIGGAILAVAAASGFVLLRRAPETGHEAAAAPVPQAPPERSPASAVVPPAPAAEGTGTAAVPTSPPAAPPRSAAAAGPAGPAASEAAPMPAPDRSAGPAREERPAAQRRPRLLSDGESFTGAVALPEGQRIELGGIVYSETEPRALLNDRILAVGDYVEGFTVSGIEPDRVALEKDGLTIYVLLK
jgi:hypothetical protein